MVLRNRESGTVQKSETILLPAPARRQAGYNGVLHSGDGAKLGGNGILCVPDDPQRSALTFTGSSLRQSPA